jgi:hypothetical protein
VQVANWWGEAPERPRDLRNVYGLSGSSVGNVDMRAEPLVPGRCSIETGRKNGDN